VDAAEELDNGFDLGIIEGIFGGVGIDTGNGTLELYLAGVVIRS
jgi:hypothetical protein